MKINPPKQRSRTAKAAPPSLVSGLARFATVDVITVRARLDMDDERIADFVACGRLTVWNIATRNVEKRELRYLWDDLASPIGSRGTPSEYYNRDARFMAGFLFGEGKTFVDGTDFRRAFNCDSKHVLNLIRAGVLEVLPNTGWHKGRNGTPAIAWKSGVNFVQERRKPEWIE